MVSGRSRLTKTRGVKAERKSLNDVVVEAVEREVRRRQGMHAYTEIIRVREAVRVQFGLHPDTGPMIRLRREGQERRG